jgi:energy-coupling factor transport system ATP-binding protein
LSISIRDLWYRYPGSKEWVLRNINLNINSGEMVCITGPSACGKSTLLYLLNGIIPHALGGEMKGRVVVESLDTREHDVYELSTIVSLVQQDPENQFRTFTVKDEIAFGPENLWIPKHEILERVEQSLQIVNAKHLADRTMMELSGGEKQRIALAAALSMKPKILVLDEPTSNIDPKGAVELAQNLRNIRSKTNITVIIVEHRLDLFLWMSDRLIIMNEGEIVCNGAPRSVLQKYQGLLLKIGVRPPQTFELFDRLSNLGVINNSHYPLSIEEIEEKAEFFRQLFQSDFCVCAPVSSGRTSEGEVVIRVDGLTYDYPGGIRALDGIDLEVRKGEFIGIIGNNGAGKTTFLLHLIGILKPKSGNVSVLGMDTRTTPVSIIARRVGMVFQYPSQQLFEESVRDEILFAPKNFSMRENELSDRFKEISKTFDLERLEDRYPQSLSVGQMRRLNLASILIYDPDIIILDEPFFGQDYGHVERIMDLLEKLNEEGKTIMIVSHNIVELAEHVRRLILFKDGRIIEDGPTRRVMNSMVDKEEKQYFCTPVCRLSRLLTKHAVLEAPTTVDEILSVLMRRRQS